MYSPKINEELVRKLYQYKHTQSPSKPMTKMVSEAVTEYLKKNEKATKQ